ncbi:MAG: helix-turn-helix transcriptional regulator [Bacteroidetes bacterium]|nr:helix-turn-helix transcriptional regulator [Bacteroidota bacterium]
MTKAKFTNNSTITVIAKDGEVFTLKAYFPVPIDKHAEICKVLVYYFEEKFSDDKSSMIYEVLIKMMYTHGFSFTYGGSDRNEERERIGAKIKKLREEKGIEAKQLALLANIDAANLSRIEKGRYAVGLDILARISNALGVKVDLV